MNVYCTSKNTGPSFLDPVHMLYLGTSLTEAKEAVGDFSRYERAESQYPLKYAEAYSALPSSIQRVFIKYYMADGWWYSIVMFSLDAKED